MLTSNTLNIAEYRRGGQLSENHHFLLRKKKYTPNTPTSKNTQNMRVF